jgi:hypothetical protein
VVGDLPVGGGVFIHVAIQQVDRDATDLEAPDLRKDLTPGER